MHHDVEVLLSVVVLKQLGYVFPKVAFIKNNRDITVI